MTAKIHDTKTHQELQKILYGIPGWMSLDELTLHVISRCSDAARGWDEEFIKTRARIYDTLCVAICGGDPVIKAQPGYDGYLFHVRDWRGN